MKLLWRLSREAKRYKTLYVVSILATLCLTGVNLAAPKVLSAMTGIVERGVDEAALGRIGMLAAVLTGLYLFRIALRFMSSYLSHKAAWYLVGDLRTKTYDKLERMHLGYFHDKQTGDLMSRVVNDTRDFELLYAHIIPDLITNVVTCLGVLAVLAGNDLLCSTEYAKQYQAVLEAVQNDKIPMHVLDAAAKRVIQWKISLELIEN